jgi:peptide deformylase
MAVMKIIEYPDPRLRIKAQPVTTVTAELRLLADNMFETMYAAPGIGLAATQVDRHIRLLVLDVSETRDQPWCFINPEIVSLEGSDICEEGCLSVPGVNEPVERAARIRVRALDRNGKSFELDAEGLLAVCIQHEMDHLEGKLFVDYLSELKRSRLKKRAAKARRKDSVESSRQPEAVR